ncbi:MAG: TonB-dependent receptor, partial [Acidobacteria bacterium]|nr:TonB-dependent receptor [Acidobacteriota bacterium]
FHRNDNLDARNFFDRDPENPSKRSDPPEFRRNQFGGALGGPIVRDKTFFFGSYEGLRELKGETNTVLVPTADARRGIGVLRRGDVIDPVVRPYLDYYPLPNGKIFGIEGEFVGPTDRTSHEDFFTVRVDHQLTASDSLAGRYRFSDSDFSTPSLLPPVTADIGTMRKQYATLEHTRVFSSTVLNSANFSFSRSAPISGFESEKVPENLHFLLPPRRDTFGQIQITGVDALGPSQVGPPLRFLLNTWQFNDNLSLTKGSHWMKMGVNLYRFQYNGFTSSRELGRFTFRSLRDFLINNVSQFEFATEGSAGSPRGARETLIGLYIQDDWKVRPNLTLNLGLRYEFYTTPTEHRGRVSNLRFRNDSDLTTGDPFIDNPSFDQFAPRVGFAWDPFGNGKTSIRGGTGLFYANLIPFNYSSMFQQNPPFYQIGQISGAKFPQPVVTGARIIPSFVFGLQYDLQTPYTLQWGLQVQRELPGNAVVNIGYTGSRGVHLSGMKDNTAIPTLRDGRQFFPSGAPVRNPNFGTLRYQSYDANSFYHGLLLSFTKRYSAGLQFRTAYTWSKAIDESSTQGEAGDWGNVVQFVLDPDDVRRDRGLAAFHTLHNLSVSSTYDLPFSQNSPIGGWQIGGILSAQSGLPVAVQIGFSRSRNGSRGSGVVDRPDLAASASNNPVRGGPDQYFDPNAFLLPEAGYHGNLGRNTLIGPGRVSFDFSLVKNTYLSRISENFN